MAIHVMKNTSRKTLPFPASICFKYLNSRLTEQGITVTSANGLFHQLRVVVPTKWLSPRTCLDIKILGKSDSSDVYIIHRRIIPFNFAPVDNLIRKQIGVIAEAIEPVT